MARVKVTLHGTQGRRTTEVTPQGFPTRHVRTGIPEPTPPPTITPELKTPKEIEAEATHELHQHPIDQGREDDPRDDPDHKRDFKRIYRLATRVLNEIHETQRQGTFF